MTATHRTTASIGVGRDVESFARRSSKAALLGPNDLLGCSPWLLESRCGRVEIWLRVLTRT